MNKTLLIILIIIILLVIAMFVIPALIVNKAGNDIADLFGENADSSDTEQSVNNR